MVRLGVNPIGWSNDDLEELGGDIPLEACLAEARLAGYEGIELGRKFPRRAAELGPLLARHGLSLVSGWYGARLLGRSVGDELAAVQGHLDLLAAMGSPVMVFAEVTDSIQGRRDVPLSRRPTVRGDGWRRLGDGVTAVAEHLRRRGVRLAYHHHMGTVVETEEEIDRMMEATSPAVGLLLDTGHLTYAGADVLGVARRHAARLVHVHCKDVRPAVLADVRRRDLPFLEAVLAGVFTVPGDGAVDFGGLMRLLKGAAYSGWLVVEAEQDPAVANPLTYARMGASHLRQVLTAAALT